MGRHSVRRLVIECAYFLGPNFLDKTGAVENPTIIRLFEKLVVLAPCFYV